MRLIDADIGREKLWEIYNAWNLAMAPAEGREIAYIDKKMRLCELMIKFLDQLPTILPPPNDPLTLEELREMDGEPVWVVHPEYKPGWALVRVTWTVTMLVFNDGKMIAAEFAMLEKGCKIYRRKPEEGTA